MGRKPCLAVVAAVAMLPLLIGVVGCGGGDATESGTTATSPPDRPAETAESPAPGAESPADEKGEGDGKGTAQKRKEYEDKRYGSPSPQSAPFAKYSERAGPKLHLAEFGSEAEAGDREQAEEAVVAYLGYVAAGKWDAACPYLQEGAFSEVQKATGNSAVDCGTALRAAIEMLEESGGGPIAVPTAISSLRIETGERAGEGAGFVLFHTPGGADRWIAVRKEGGEWKMISIAPQPFR